jgi:hypothetical protein
MYQARFHPEKPDNKLVDLTESYLEFKENKNTQPGLSLAQQVNQNKDIIVRQQLETLLAEFERKWNLTEEQSPKLISIFKKQYVQLMNQSYDLMLLTFADIPKPWDRKIDGQYAWSKNWIYEAMNLPDWGFDSYYQKGLRAEMLYYRLNAKDAGERFDRLFELF